MEQLDNETKLQQTVFFVEANSNEQHEIWREYRHRVSWEQDSMGFSQVIRYIDDDIKKPINVSFIFNILNGKRICFYDVISRYSDSIMVEEWIEENYPIKYDQGSRRAMTNAQNFHLVQSVLGEVKSEEEVFRSKLQDLLKYEKGVKKFTLLELSLSIETAIKKNGSITQTLLNQ